MNVLRLRCEYQTNPLGIDGDRPRLSWQLASARRGTRQTAYRVCVAARKNGPADLWDSGKIKSDQSVHVVYAGQKLKPGQRAWWRVTVWDEAGKPATSTETAWWELGLPGVDWEAEWIGSPIVGGKKAATPAPHLRTEFTLPKKRIVRARLYATALGVYEAALNGQPVGDEVFAPGWTDYAQRVQYQTFDVRAQLTPGANCFGAILGDGWYCGYVGEAGQRETYGEQSWFKARLVVEFADGSTQVVVTNDEWQVASGPILAADFLMGEIYDARRELTGWAVAGYDARGWLAVRINIAPPPLLVARLNPPVRRIMEIKSISQRKYAKGWTKQNWIFDLGQNMVGRVRLKARGGAGCTVVLRHAEMLKPDGTPYYDNLRSAAATDAYTFKGDGIETFEPRFTFHGFRYVEVEGLEGEPLPDAVTGIVLHSDTPPTGKFHCSDPLINQLQHNIEWGQRGNFLEVPTDCPQRDERLGWTGDAHVFCRTAAFNMNVATFFTKWLQDMRDAQGADGAIPSYMPTASGRGGDGGPAWADAAVIVPWTMYQCYGDRRILEEQYPAVVRFIDFIKAQSKDWIRCHPAMKCHAFGDWLSQDGTGTPNEMIGTAFFAHSADLAGQMAGVLGKTADVKRFATLAGKVRRAFTRRYLTGANLLFSGTQTACVLTLHFQLIPDSARADVATQLVRDIKKRGLRLSTGFVGTPYLNHVLTETGHLDVAYGLLFQKKWPSWLYAVTQGATTIWERWDGWTHDKGFQNPLMNSFNHYAYGAIGDWLYASVAGLGSDQATPGYKRLVFRPHPGGGLTYARATLDTMYGPAESAWKIRAGGKQTEYRFTVPPNTTASAELICSAKTKVRYGASRVQLARRSDRVMLELEPGQHQIIVG